MVLWMIKWLYDWIWSISRAIFGCTPGDIIQAASDDMTKMRRKSFSTFFLVKYWISLPLSPYFLFYHQHVNDSGDILMINFISCLNFLCKLDVNLFSLAYSLQATLCARGRMKLEKIRKEIRTFEKLTKLSIGIRWISRQRRKSSSRWWNFSFRVPTFQFVAQKRAQWRRRGIGSSSFFIARDCLISLIDWFFWAYIFLPLFAFIATSSLLEPKQKWKFKVPFLCNSSQSLVSLAREEIALSKSDDTGKRQRLEGEKKMKEK